MLLSFFQFMVSFQQHMVYKTYILINSNLKSWFFAKNADISKIKRVLVLKDILSETTYVCVLSYQISSF